MTVQMNSSFDGDILDHMTFKSISINCCSKLQTSTNTRVPLEYCRFRSEYFFFRFDSRLKREAYNLVMVSTMYLKITELHYQNINKNMLYLCICFLSSLNIRIKGHCTTKDYSESFLTPSSQKDDISRRINNER